jgi:hypothetical protein
MESVSSVPPPKPKPRRDPGISINGWLRTFLIFGGVVLMGLGTASWIWAPKHTAFAPSATMKDATAKISAPSETISTALIAAGVLLVLVGVNGRKLASIKIGGDELSFAHKAAGVKTKKKAADEGLSAEKASDAQALAEGNAYLQALSEPADVDPDAIAEEAV